MKNSSISFNKIVKPWLHLKTTIQPQFMLHTQTVLQITALVVGCIRFPWDLRDSVFRLLPPTFQSQMQFFKTYFLILQLFQSFIWLQKIRIDMIKSSWQLEPFSNWQISEKPSNPWKQERKAASDDVIVSVYSDLPCAFFSARWPICLATREVRRPRLSRNRVSCSRTGHSMAIRRTPLVVGRLSLTSTYGQTWSRRRRRTSYPPGGKRRPLRPTETLATKRRVDGQTKACANSSDLNET